MSRYTTTVIDERKKAQQPFDELPIGAWFLWPNVNRLFAKVTETTAWNPQTGTLCDRLPTKVTPVNVVISIVS